MTQNNLPVVGAAMLVEQLPFYAEWILSEQRDLEIQDPYHVDIFDGNWRELSQQARSVLDGYSGRLGIHAAFDGLSLGTQDVCVREVVVKRLMQSIEFGAELGATHMVVHSPYIFFGRLDNVLPDKQTKVMVAAQAALEKVVAFAQQANCTIVLENIYDLYPHSLISLVRSFDSAQVRLSLDVGHALIMQHLGGATADHWIYEGRDMLAHVHLQDNDGHLDRHWRLGRGAVNWWAIFAALHSLTTQPRLILELKEKNDILPSAQWLAENGFAR